MFTDYYEGLVNNFIFSRRTIILDGLLFTEYYEDRPKDGPMIECGQCLLTIMKRWMDHDKKWTMSTHYYEGIDGP